MEFVILGSTALRADGWSVPIGPAKQRAMFALLLYHVGVPVRVDTLVEQLWNGHGSVTDRRTSLYAMTSRIRSVLASVGITNALIRVNNTAAYRLDLDPATIDFHRFRRLVAEARRLAVQHRHGEVTALLADAIALWAGEPLADLRTAHAEHLRRQMTDALLDAHKLMADSQLRTGQHQAVLLRLEPLLPAYDLDEALAQRWIDALCAADREDDARAFFLAFRRHFRKEFRVDPTVVVPYPGNRSVPAGGGPVPAGGGPPPRSTPARAPAPALVPRQLPKDIGDFVGHEDLLAQLDALSAASDPAGNAVALSGMPGVGKTTLVTHWAQRRCDRYPDGQLYLNANGFGAGPPMDSATALGRLLTALDVPARQLPKTLDKRRDLLNELLSGRRMLIVLDNVRDSGQVRPLIPTSPQTFTLITSRTRLRGLSIREGIRCLTVPSLPERDCLTLLTQVIGADRAGAEAAAVRALAQLSCGLPLALRIMGQRVAEWPQVPVADLVEELNVHLLSADGDDEEVSLYSVFAWSYEALRPDAAHLFRILGLAPTATVSLEAAAAMVAAPASEVHVLLSTLTKAHLVTQASVWQYRLHDLLRRYAVGHALREEPPAQQHEALRRLLDWYLLSATNAAGTLAPDRPPVPDLPEPGAVEPLTFQDDAQATRWAEAERGNVGSIVRWAAAHGFHRRAWQLAGTVHEIYDRYGRQEDVLEINRLALSAARQDGHPLGELGTLIDLGATHFALRDYPPAAQHFTEALRLAREIGHDGAEATCLHNLASIHLRTGNLADAIRMYAEVLAICRRTGDALGEGSTLHRLGNAYRRTGRYHQAITYYRDALAIRRRIGSLRGQGETFGELGATYLEMGAAEVAFDHCRSAIDIDSRTKDEAARCDALTTMAQARRALGMTDEAVADAGRAVAVADEIGDRQRQCRALIVLADLLNASGNAGGGRQARAHAEQLLTEVPATEAAPLAERLAALGAA